jgi:hypothetical protein
VLRNTRAHVMPPPGEKQPTVAEQRALEQWIKTGGFGLDPAQPDPGRVTVRRLNRTEHETRCATSSELISTRKRFCQPMTSATASTTLANVEPSPNWYEKFIQRDDLREPWRADGHGGHATTDDQGGDFRTADGAQTAERYSYYQAHDQPHLQRQEGRSYR